MEQKTNRGTESFNIGELAVENSDTKAQAAPLNPPPLTHQPSSNSIPLQPNEHIVTTVKRHLIGLAGIYFISLLGLIAIISLAFVLLPTVSSHISKQDYGMIGAISIFIAAFLIILLYISTKVYRGCKLLVTDKNLVMINRRSLFNTKVSRLSMSNVEDVNVEQRGILQNILNYGTLTIQTAGEIDNFIFPYCPRPNDYAQRILNARESFAAKG